MYCPKQISTSLGGCECVFGQLNVKFTLDSLHQLNPAETVYTEIPIKYAFQFDRSCTAVGVKLGNQLLHNIKKPLCGIRLRFRAALRM
jgi:hypothetical protein